MNTLLLPPSAMRVSSPFSRLFASSSNTTLAGTVLSHQCYILLHSHQPPKDFSSHISSAVQRALQLKASKWGGIVNFSWSPDQPVHETQSGLEPEAYFASAFSLSRGRLEIPEISLSNLDEVDQRLREHVEASPAELDESSQDIHLYVCTHGARDCRCGDTGGAVVKALREELARRSRTDPHGRSQRVKVAEVGHVGGHKYAANLLVLPHGEWLGHLNPEGVPGMLDSILRRSVRPSTPNDPPLCGPHWRGRMGLGKEEQKEFYSAHTRLD